jgi:hypothetical protein
MEFVGYALLAVAVLEFAFGLYVSFTSEGGSLGQVPVLAHAIAFPLLLTMALLCFHTVRVGWFRFPIGVVLLGFPVGVVLDGFLIIKAGQFGRSCHIRHKLRNSEPGAPPNGGPATQLGNSGVSKGPPSVS